MRWARLFDDLGAEFDDAAAAERDALAADLAAEEWATLSWRDLLGERCELDVEGVGVVSGDVVRTGEEVIWLNIAGTDLLVAAGAVAVVRATSPRTPAPSSPGSFGWRRVLRALAADGGRVLLHRRDGVIVEGHVDAVGGDFMVVRQAAGDRQVVVVTAIAAVRGVM